MFNISAVARLALLTILLVGFLVRLAAMVSALKADDERPLLGFPLAVIFPAVLIILLAAMPPARSREGLLMRVGTVVQLLLIILLPEVSLYLALGFPVVFLVVELFETRAPVALRAVVNRVLIA
jgi:hypothetical protein